MSTNIPLPLQLSRKRTSQGFSLIEMLVVISIASILSVLATVGFRSIMGSVENGQVSDIGSTLIRARAYAMANNTYVFVGIQEVLVTNPSAGTQTAPGSGNVGGRIAVSVMASSDGTHIYQSSNVTPGTALDRTPIGSPSSLNIVSPVHYYDNLHLLTSPGAGLSNLPNTSTSGATYNIASTTSYTTFTWPLGSASPQYPTFGTNGTVIQFTPRGKAQIVTGTYADLNLQWIEIDLTPTNGTTVYGKNPATILIDGASGSVTTYRE